jgi:glycine cleavage system H protein
MYPQDYRFTKDHEWVKLEGGEAVVGVSDFAQHQLGDIIYVELPAVGKTLEVRGAIGTIESVKSVSDIYAPVAGEVTAANEALAEAADLINKDPHGQGWICRIKLADPKAVDSLMTAADYEKYLEGLES